MLTCITYRNITEVIISYPKQSKLFPNNANFSLLSKHRFNCVEKLNKTILMSDNNAWFIDSENVFKPDLAQTQYFVSALRYQTEIKG